MPDLNTITSVPAVIIMALVCRGLLQFCTGRASPELRYFSIGLTMVLGTQMLRTLYWGTIRGVVIEIDPSAWAAWSAYVNGPDRVNGAFNMLFIIGALYICRALHAMIPATERSNWTWLAAPLYPKGWCFVRISRIFREGFQNRR